MRRLLVVEDNKALRESLIDYFLLKKDLVKGTDSVSEALKMLKKEDFDIIISDLNLIDKSGIELIKIVKSTKSNIEIIVITGISSIDVAIDAIKGGAFQYLTKPFKVEELEVFIDKAYEKLGLEKEVKTLKSELIEKNAYEGIIAYSSRMKKVIEKVKQISSTEASVLITGESGTGKELIAKTIHFNSSRSNGPFIPLNCSALPETLLESELFGYEKGSFTGANTDKKGKFELAEGGTLFLDEIGEISQFVQVKLLRFLETKEIMSIGSSKIKNIDTRIVFATNQNLKELIERNMMREDFYYRIKVVEINIPPLRERTEDIYPLANFFMIELCRKHKRSLMQFSKEVIEIFKKHQWDGNVRELKNTIEQIVIFHAGQMIEKDDLPENISAISGKKAGNTKDIGDMKLEEIEKIAIEENLRKHNYNQSKVAKILGVTRATLLSKIKKYNIIREELP